MPLDHATGEHRGFGFVEFESADDAAAAIDNMHNSGERVQRCWRRRLIDAPAIALHAPRLPRPAQGFYLEIQAKRHGLNGGCVQPCTAAMGGPCSRATLAMPPTLPAELYGRVLRVNYAQPNKIKGGDKGFATQAVWADADDW